MAFIYPTDIELDEKPPSAPKASRNGSNLLKKGLLHIYDNEMLDYMVKILENTVKRELK